MTGLSSEVDNYVMLILINFFEGMDDNIREDIENLKLHYRNKEVAREYPTLPPCLTLLEYGYVLSLMRENYTLLS